MTELVIKSMQLHPLTRQFPEIRGSGFDELVASIKADGLKEPITTFERAILDGRNRYRACIAAGVEPRFEEFTGDDPVKFVIEKNVLRRHLTSSQRAMIAESWRTQNGVALREMGQIWPLYPTPQLQRPLRSLGIRSSMQRKSRQRALRLCRRLLNMAR